MILIKTLSPTATKAATFFAIATFTVPDCFSASCNPIAAATIAVTAARNLP